MKILEKNTSPGIWSQILIVLLAFELLVIITSTLPINLKGTLVLLMVSGLITTVILYFLSMFLAKKARLSAQQVGLSFANNYGLKLIIGIAIGLVIFATHCFVITRTTDAFIEPTNAVTAIKIISMAVLFLILAAMEEVAFRGFVLFRLNEKYGAFISQLFVATAFALYHMTGGWNTSVLIGTFFASFLFSSAALYSRGLALPIGIHAAWNFCSWFISDKLKYGQGFYEVQVLSHDSLPGLQKTATISYFAVLGTAALIFILSYRKTRKIGS